MKTIASAVLGLSLTLASAGLSLAAQDTKTATQTDNKTAPVAKKHKKVKKAKSTTPAASTMDAKPAPTK